MSTNYKETTIAGTSWQRACRAVIEHPLDNTSSVMYVEEKAINLGDSLITQLCSNVGESFERGKLFPKYNPLTAEIIAGEFFSHDDYYQIVFSHYMHLATQRDAA